MENKKFSINKFEEKFRAVLDPSSMNSIAAKNNNLKYKSKKLPGQTSYSMLTMSKTILVPREIDIHRYWGDYFEDEQLIRFKMEVDIIENSSEVMKRLIKVWRQSLNIKEALYLEKDNFGVIIVWM
jgi:hypothetical protein